MPSLGINTPLYTDISYDGQKEGLEKLKLINFRWKYANINRTEMQYLLCLTQVN